MNPMRVTSSRYDLGGHSVGRVLRQALLNRLIPFGWFAGGPNIKYGIELWLRHVFGRPIYALRMRIDPLAWAIRRRTGQRG